jgi:hypothetical protein
MLRILADVDRANAIQPTGVKVLQERVVIIEGKPYRQVIDENDGIAISQSKAIKFANQHRIYVPTKRRK